MSAAAPLLVIHHVVDVDMEPNGTATAAANSEVTGMMTIVQKLT
jgi:hypothetical protein